MKIFDELTARNFKLFASHHYNNPECLDVEEFKQDLNRFKYLKRLLKRYELTGELQERLILNHIIVIKPFLVFLNYLPEKEKVDVGMDPFIVEVLRKL